MSILPLDCSGDNSWVHGSSLINYMKLVEFVGLSGKTTFDTKGLRTMFYLDVLELQASGLEPIGNYQLGLAPFPNYKNLGRENGSNFKART